MPTLEANPRRFSDTKGRHNFNKITDAHAKLLDILTAAGIPWRALVIVPRYEEPIMENGRLKTYELDVLAWEKVDIEVDGRSHWRNRKQVRHDEERDAYLTAQGITVLRFDNASIKLRPEEVLAEILAAKPR